MSPANSIYCNSQKSFSPLVDIPQPVSPRPSPEPDPRYMFWSTTPWTVPWNLRPERLPVMTMADHDNLYEARYSFIARSRISCSRRIADHCNVAAAAILSVDPNPSSETVDAVCRHFGDAMRREGVAKEPNLRNDILRPSLEHLTLMASRVKRRVLENKRIGKGDKIIDLVRGWMEQATETTSRKRGSSASPSPSTAPPSKRARLAESDDYASEDSFHTCLSRPPSPTLSIAQADELQGSMQENNPASTLAPQTDGTESHLEGRNMKPHEEWTEDE
ncbi:hypothetical protein K402DRAFT_183113 [Aulographum hederae CBS 113979]|uniref:Uncharacterized protein n=1 Tax=Aulographum hederae CBS 113979 TaxID=1176131 RepID=A0A6G1GQ22_9PEZI|nr:hypothetical protein K402DRAFT_183113 [Aulographum hederae CBS 113979]